MALELSGCTYLLDKLLIAAVVYEGLWIRGRRRMSCSGGNGMEHRLKSGAHPRSSFSVSGTVDLDGRLCDW